jgi:hypothetical protein
MSTAPVPDPDSAVRTTARFGEYYRKRPRGTRSARERGAPFNPHYPPVGGVMSDTISHPTMTPEELHRALLLEQRYEYSHRDPDSEWDIPTRVNLVKGGTK